MGLFPTHRNSLVIFTKSSQGKVRFLLRREESLSWEVVFGVRELKDSIEDIESLGYFLSA